MKKCHIIMLLLLSVFSANAELCDYATLNKKFNERLFLSGKIEFDNRDLQQARSLYKAAKKDVDVARIKYLEALALFYALVPDYGKSEKLVNESLTVLTKEKYPAENARLKLLQAMLSRRYRYEYGKCYHGLSEALSSFKELRDTLYIAKTYSQLGVLWIELSDFKNATDCNSRAEELYGHTKYKQNMSYMRCNSYIIYSYQGKYDKSISMMKKEMKLNEHSLDTAYVFILNHNIGQNFFMKGETDSALYYYDKALAVIRECSKPNLDYKALAYWSLGELYVRTKQKKLAVENLDKSLDYAKSADMREKECDIYHKLYEIYSAGDDYKTACLMMGQYELLHDSIDKKSNVQEVKRMKYQMELNDYRQQAKIAKQKDEIKQTFMLVVLYSLVLLLVVFAFVLFFINHRRKLQKMRNVQLTEQLEKEEMTQEIQRLEHERNMEEKNREVATTQLLLAEKNSLLNQLIESLMPYKKSGELPAAMWRVINNFVQGNMRKDEEWGKFKLHFEKVHPEFFVKLKEACPDLTENELHLCSYIKIGGRSKEIAEMLSISPASVTTSRYRIKKKLQLKDESLDDYLRRL